ncbi:MAG: Spo0E family sporulation regulatory protein-aspartic acid phosphatase [Tissierellia bacterium]|nr:Spo0E family sporulation regulatory protein-aspartic acid phosphatase [Tissierellia bacterium]
MKDKVERLRDLLYEKIESKEKNEEEIIKISKELDKVILKYYGVTKNKN